MRSLLFMEIGILGLPQSGKSTLFEIMTGIKSREIHGEPYVRGIAKVPDRRFDKLVEIFSPVKAIPAQIPFIDICPQASNPWDTIRKALSTADGLVHVIDAFTINNPQEVASQYQKLADELIISDLVAVESRLEKLQKIPKGALKPDEAMQAEIFPHLKETLDNGHPIRSLKISPSDMRVLRGFAFWTLRPELVVVNCREDNISFANTLKDEAKISSPLIGICCQMEAEIAELPPNERAEFLAGLGTSEPAFEKIIRTAFALLGRICYFTVGPDEVRAWVIPTSSVAPRAAAAIHKDFERGFIKAEVVSYDDFISSGESHAKAKSAGKLRLEGKEYIVQDGDIISFRFNV